MQPRHSSDSPEVSWWRGRTLPCSPAHPEPPGAATLPPSFIFQQQKTTEMLKADWRKLVLDTPLTFLTPNSRGLGHVEVSVPHSSWECPFISSSCSLLSGTAGMLEGEGSRMSLACGTTSLSPSRLLLCGVQTLLSELGRILSVPCRCWLLSAAPAGPGSFSCSQ